VTGTTSGNGVLRIAEDASMTGSGNFSVDVPSAPAARCM
jgi:hypothetical protein